MIDHDTVSIVSMNLKYILKSSDDLYFVTHSVENFLQLITKWILFFFSKPILFKINNKIPSNYPTITKTQRENIINHLHKLKFLSRTSWQKKAKFLI